MTAAPGADLIVIAPEPARIAEIPKAEGDASRRGDVLVRFEIPSLAAEVASQRRAKSRARRRGCRTRGPGRRARTICSIAAWRRARKSRTRTARSPMRRPTWPPRRPRTAPPRPRPAWPRSARTFDGVVAKRYAQPGDVVEAAATDPVLRVIDPKRLEVTASVPIPDVAAHQHRRDRPHRTSRPATARSTLKVVSRPAAVEAGTASVPVRLAFAAPATSRRRHAGAGRDRRRGARDVVLVPIAAVVREGGRDRRVRRQWRQGRAQASVDARASRTASTSRSRAASRPASR